jgi:hypothetical protein
MTKPHLTPRAKKLRRQWACQNRFFKKYRANSVLYVKNCPPRLRMQFRACAHARGETITDAVVNFMRWYCKEYPFELLKPIPIYRRKKKIKNAKPH